MSLQTKIESKLNEAVKAQDKKTYSTLRLVVAAIKDTMIAKKIKDKKIFGRIYVLMILNCLIKINQIFKKYKNKQQYSKIFE